MNNKVLKTVPKGIPDTFLDWKLILKTLNEKMGIFLTCLQKRYFSCMPELTEIIGYFLIQALKKYEEDILSFQEELNNQISDLFSFRVIPWMLDPF